MANNNVEQRERPFDLYAANLKLFIPGHDLGKFLCPICLKDFDRASVYPPGPTLSLAHVYPDAAGGELTTLECTKCNNTLGSRYDKHLVTNHQAFEKVKKGERMRGRLWIGTRSMAVMILWDGTTLNMREIKGSTNPKDSAEILARVSSGGPFQFTIEYEAGDSTRLKVALLHAAYLCLFRDFGYEVVTEVTKWVRELLNGEPPETIPQFLTMSVPVAEIGVPPSAHFRSGVAVIDGVRCFTAIFPSPNPEAPTWCVYLPGPGDFATAYW